MPEPVYLLDASIYIFRAWFGLPDAWMDRHGRSLNAVIGYGRFLLRWLERHRPAYVGVAFDEALFSGFRHRLYPGYKASRALPDEGLAWQLTLCRRLSERLGLVCRASRRYEADDLIASMAARARQAGYPVVILSRDKDLGQILRPGDTLWDPAEDRRLTADTFADAFGVPPHQVVDYLSLLGDVADDIPGVPGVGARTAASLLAAYGSLDALYEAVVRGEPLPVRRADYVRDQLQSHESQVRLAQGLIRLREDVTSIPPTPALRVNAPDSSRLTTWLRRQDLNGLEPWVARWRHAHSG